MRPPLRALGSSRTANQTFAWADVTKEAGSSPLFPIRRIVRIDAGARTQHAEKGMLSGVDHNPSMSLPDGQVAWLRTSHSPKFVNPDVKIRGTRVPIRETGAPIEFMDKVRAIGIEIRMRAGIQSTQNRQTIAHSQQPGHSRLLRPVRDFASE